VSACPVDAIARIEPVAVMRDVREALGATSGPAPDRSHARRVDERATLPAQRPSWPWTLGASIVACAVVYAVPHSQTRALDSGLAAGFLLAALWAYSAAKRLPRRGEGTRSVSRVRPHAIAHIALGILAFAVVGVHGGWRAPPNAAGALSVAFWLASGAGVFGAIAYRMGPRALARVERRAMLAEDIPARAKELDERAFGALTGRSDATKEAYARVLAPYASAPLGPLSLLARRSSLREEEDRLKARVARSLGKRVADMDGLDDLIRRAVERRAIAAQRILQFALRGWVPLHLVASAIVLVLLLVHVILVVRIR
jgi:hypothetical protein